MILDFFRENMNDNIIDAHWFYRGDNNCYLQIRFKDCLKTCITVPDFHWWINQFDERIAIEQLREFKGRIQNIEWDYLVDKPKLPVKSNICRVFMKWNQEMME